MTPKEMALEILHRLNRLETRHHAMEGLLGTLCLDGKPLNWEPLVQETIENQARTGPDALDEKYARIQQSVLDSQDDHSSILALLNGLLNDVL